MAISVNCPACGKAVRFSETAEGKKGACPHCDTFMVVSSMHAPVENATETPAWKEGDVFPAVSGHKGAVNCVTYSHGGTIALSAGDDGTARFWDISSGHETARFIGHEGAVRSVSLSPDGNFVLTGGADGSVRLWRVANAKCVRVFQGHEGEVTSVAFFPGGAFAFSSGMDGAVRKWELVTGKCLLVYKGHKGGVTSMALDPQGKFVISGGLDGLLMTWRIDKAKRIAKLKGHGGPVRCLALNRDGGIAISGSDDLSAMIWSIAKGRRVKLLTGHFVSVTSAAIDFDNTRAATGSADWALRVWDVDTAKPLFKLESERDSVTALAFQPGTFEILGGYSSGALRLYDAQSGRLMDTLGGDASSVDTRCPSCAKLFAVPKAFIGRKGLCPWCSAAFAAGEYSPDKSTETLTRAKALFSYGKKAEALALFDEAILLQGDNHEAILHAIICRNHVSADLQQAGKHSDAVKMLERALRLFASDKAWPTAIYANARQQAYTAAFLAGKTCRYNLSDIPSAVKFLKYAQQLNNTLDVQDMLSHLS